MSIRKSNEALDEQRNQTDGDKNKLTERLRKTLSEDILPSPVSDTALGPQILSGAHRAISPEGLPCFQVCVCVCVRERERSRKTLMNCFFFVGLSSC